MGHPHSHSTHSLHLDVNSRESHVWTSVKGSRGYLDPAYIISGKVTIGSDIYAFGVLICEVLSGKLPLDLNRHEEEYLLSKWVLKRGAAEIKDPEVIDTISKRSLNICFEIAKKCLHDKPHKRPKMSQVLVELEFALEEQGRKGPKSRLNIWQFCDGGTPSGSTQEDHINQVEMELNRLLGHIQEDASEHDQAVDMSQHVDIQDLAIPLADLQKMTQNFDKTFWIAYGSSTSGSTVSYGVLRTTEQATAIKRLHNKLPDQEFLAQVSTLSSLNHQNVVKLLGFCVDDGMQILVSEFASKRSLHDRLHGQRDMDGSYLEAGRALSWARRSKIAVEVAKGLCYVHDMGLIHRNIKSNNFLRFRGGTAKITDLHPSNPCCCNSDRRSPTCELYHPSEFYRSGHSQELDVHNFVVVLLELLTGKKVFDDPTLPKGMNLVKWAKPQLMLWYQVQLIVDDRLEDDYVLGAVGKMAAVAASCLADEASSRPKMETVLSDLEEALWEIQNYYHLRQRQQ